MTSQDCRVTDWALTSLIDRHLSHTTPHEKACVLTQGCLTWLSRKATFHYELSLLNLSHIVIILDTHQIGRLGSVACWDNKGCLETPGSNLLKLFSLNDFVNSILWSVCLDSLTLHFLQISPFRCALATTQKRPWEVHSKGTLEWKCSNLCETSE